jgi:hypothetical protein
LKQIPSEGTRPTDYTINQFLSGTTPRSKMNLVLHIGTEKTGTTSIQLFLKHNIAQLERNGIYIPRTPMIDSGNHRWIPLFAKDVDAQPNWEVLKLLPLQHFKSVEDRNIRISQKRDQFLSECQNAANSTCNTIILTSEHFQSTLRSADELHKLRALVENFSNSIRIFIYIRDPLKTAISLLSNQLKIGKTPRNLSSPTFGNIEYICNHAETIQRWHECFPNAEIIVRRFDRGRLKNGNVVVDFCAQVMGDFREDDYTFLQPVNETLTLTGMALLRKLNLRLPALINNRLNPMRGDAIVDFVMEHTSGERKFLPCRDEFDIYKHYFSESCEWVRYHYFPHETSLFSDEVVFAEEKIDLESIEVDSRLYEELVISLWRRQKELESRLNEAA